jgi:hypothetical protein
MSDILDNGLREQLAAALLGWGGGGQRTPRDTIDLDSDSASRETPKPEPGLGRLGYIRGLIDFADEEDRPIVDDIDADSVCEASDDGRSERHFHQAGYATENPVSQKALPPLPIETPLASPQPQMSCRLSRVPISHPCEVPELMPDKEDTSAMAASPPVSGPVTPSVAPDVFRPLTLFVTPELELGSIINPAFGLESDRPRKMSIKSADTGASDGLGIIQEEDDANTDSVSLLTPTEVSFGTSSGDGSGPTRVDKYGFLTADGRKHGRSVSSAGSGSSGEWRPSQSSARRSVNFLSRMRNGGRVEEECLEKRSLTPAQLSAPIHAQGASDDELPTPGGASPTSPSAQPNRVDASTAARFFKRMPWISDSSKTPEAVFGVELKESIRVAPMKIRISHKGRSTSYRTFPLAVHKCCEFIRRAGTSYPFRMGLVTQANLLAGGTDANIFACPGNAYNVASLKEIFSLAPSYGERFQFEGSDYSVHDAARLILVFLEELPRPLIPPSVVKSWILLARQEGAIEPPCPRVETGLDFWTEALNRLPTPNRNLTKHLLTLFAEVLLAATGRITEEDARQLASAVSRAMFHQDADVEAKGKDKNQKKKSPKRNVQPTLALAFLIKKRGEYAVSLGEAVANNASRRDSKFLPSTREILEWKGAAQ